MLPLAGCHYDDAAATNSQLRVLPRFEHIDLCYDGCQVTANPEHTPGDVLEREKAVAAIVECKRLRRTVRADGTFFYEVPRRTPRVADDFKLCSDEQLSEVGLLSKQPRLAECTAFLVGERGSRTLVSADHCGNPYFLKKTVAVFGFRTAPSGELIDDTGAPKSGFGPDEVFEIEHAVARLDGRDWGLARLKRETPSDRTTLPLDCNVQVSIGDSIYAMGHPLGTAIAYASDAHVIGIAPDAGYYHATLDTFLRNSGSPVLRADGGVIGVLPWGGGDFDDSVASDGGTCKRIRYCRSSDMNGACSGESVLPIKYVCNALSDNETWNQAMSVDSCDENDFSKEE